MVHGLPGHYRFYVAVTGSMLGCYRVYVDVTVYVAVTQSTGCYTGLPAVTRSMRLLQGLCWMLQGIGGWYTVYLAMLQGLCGCYRVICGCYSLYGCYTVYWLLHGSMWLLQGLCRCYRVYAAVTGYMWMLQSIWLLHGLPAVTRSTG